jgi:hypothetical protein
LVKKIIIEKNTTAYTWDWYSHLVVDSASLKVEGSTSAKREFLDLRYRSRSEYP